MRKTITGTGGMLLLQTLKDAGVEYLFTNPGSAETGIFAAIAEFKDFTADNDPWGEHDCAVQTVNGNPVIFKIDYLDRSRRIHSPDPADPKVTVRVMTVMLADEY